MPSSPAHPKKSLLLWCQHGLESCVLFINLVKAYDTVNHQLMYAMLAKYSMPETLISIIKKYTQTAKYNYK